MLQPEARSLLQIDDLAKRSGRPRCKERGPRNGGDVALSYLDEISGCSDAAGRDGRFVAAEGRAQQAPGPGPGNHVVVDNLHVAYESGNALLRKTNLVVKGVSFSIRSGACLALVGESGSGKSTIARALLALLPIASGKITVGSFNFPPLHPSRAKAFRREVQVVFQDPYLALNPRHSIQALIEEPLVVHRFDRQERKERLEQVLERVNLDPRYLPMRPAQLSGGLRQRVCIARSLVLDPHFLIADEPVSALDLSAQARIMDLLADLKEHGRLTTLFVTHDLELAQFLADDVGVLLAGRLVELGPVASVLSSPLHPYTRSLLSSVPSRLVVRSDEGIKARHAPDRQGCPFAPNCPLMVDVCRETPPELEQATPLQEASSPHLVACFRAL